jgi:hypothetical protein
MKKKIQNKRSSLASIKCVDVVEMNDEEFLMMSWMRQVRRGMKCCLKNQNGHYQKELKKFTSE